MEKFIHWVRCEIHTFCWKEIHTSFLYEIRTCRLCQSHDLRVYVGVYIYVYAIGVPSSRVEKIIYIVTLLSFRNI